MGSDRTPWHALRPAGRLVDRRSGRGRVPKPASFRFTILFLTVWVWSPLTAQGSRGAAVGGRVLGRDSIAIEQATVRILNHSNGERWETATNARGDYFVEYLSVGGPYRIEVRALGYRPAARDSIFLALGQRLTLDFGLSLAALELEEVTVVAEVDRLEGARTGPTRIITDSTIARLPINGRGYPELALLSPQVTVSPNGGFSFAGTHDRLNSIQVDGASNNDLFGSAASGAGTPGWAVGLNSFTPEALKEIQVVSAPFDVRYGSFAGGLINAVTKSGSNRVEGSIHGYLEGSDLSADEASLAPYTNGELGITIGAPIVRDRLAFFLDASARRQVAPQAFPAPTPTTAGEEAGIPYDSLVRFQEALRGYGVEPGTFSAGEFRAPTRNIFGKLTLQLGVNSRLELSHDYGHGTQVDETGPRDPGVYALSSFGSETPETIHATRLAWTAGLGRLSNELLLARVDDRRRCLPGSDFSQVTVSIEQGDMLAGATSACHGAEIGFTSWELTDNVGITSGNHRITLGTHNELIDLVDEARVSSQGQWFFGGLDSLEQGIPHGYARDVSSSDSLAAFHVSQLGVYLQDQWRVTSRLTLTGGVRVEVPFVPTSPAQNPTALKTLGINTSLTPSGNLLWSPRLGVSWSARGRGTTVLRGGVGLFAGRPAFQWFRNVYRTNGALQHRIFCFGDETPAFTLDPEAQPSACTMPTPSSTSSVFNYFDPGFRFPQNLKVALGADHLLPGEIVGTVDLLFTGGVHTFHVADVNLVGPVGSASGEGGRVLYGTLDPTTGAATAHLRSDSVGSAFELRNGSGDRSWSLTGQLQRHRPDGTEWSVGLHLYRCPRPNEPRRRPCDHQRELDPGGRLARAQDRPDIAVGDGAQDQSAGHHKPPAGLAAGGGLHGDLRLPLQLRAQGRPQRRRVLAPGRCQQRPGLRADGCGRHHPGGSYDLCPARHADPERSMPAAPARPPARA